MRLFRLLLCSIVFAAGVALAASQGAADDSHPSRVAPGDSLQDAFLYDGASTGLVSFSVGDGSFVDGPVKSNFSSGWQSYTGYFDNDDLADLFLYNDPAGNAVVLFANGDGTWTQGPLDSVFGSGWDVYPGNFNNDGYTDLFVYLRGAGPTEGHVLFADGSGGWTNGLGNNTFGGGWTVFPGKYNTDIYTDLFFYNYTNSVSALLYAVGDGTWTSGSTTYPLSLSRKIQVADFNADGLTDLMVTHDGLSPGQTYMYVVFKDSGAGWTKGLGELQAPVADGRFVAADFTGDGRADILSYDQNGGSGNTLTQVLFVDNNGVLTFGPYEYGFDPAWQVKTGNFTPDSRADLFLYDQSLGGARVWIANPDGSFTHGPEVTVNPGWGQIVVADFGTHPPTPTPSPTPSPSPSPSPTPTASPTPSPTHLPTATKSPTPSPTAPSAPIQGDLTCDGHAAIEDASALLAFLATHNGDPPGCLSAAVAPAAVFPFGDVNCDGLVNVLDVLNILRHLATVAELNLPAGCEEVGQPIT